MSTTALPLTQRALDTLPPELQLMCRSHHHDNLADLIGEVWLSLQAAEAGDSVAEIFGRARSNIRRKTQAQAKWVPLDLAEEESAIRAALEEPSPMRYADYVRQIQEQHKCSRRQAQRLVRKMLEQHGRGGGQGDLFIGEMVHG